MFWKKVIIGLTKINTSITPSGRKASTDIWYNVNINIQYKLNGEIKRGGLSKKIATSPVEIFLESRPETPLASTEESKEIYPYQVSNYSGDNVDKY